MATEWGFDPVTKSLLTPRVPSPFPSSTDTVLEPEFVTARSGFPSAFMSPIATKIGSSPVPKSVFGPKVPSPRPSNTDTVPEPRFATARSSFPSTFRSAHATELGELPVERSVLVPKVPSAFPRSTDTVLEREFATARSGAPSPFRSLTTMELGPSPVSKDWKDAAKSGEAVHLPADANTNNAAKIGANWRRACMDTPTHDCLCARGEGEILYTRVPFRS